MHNSIFDNLKKAEQGAKLSILSYLFLTILKLGAGFIFRSSALVADGINNSTDVISSIFVLVGLKISRKPADEDHLYGHFRAELISTLIASFIMLYAGIEVVIYAVKKIITNSYEQPNILSAIVNGLYLVLIQIGMGVVTFLPALISNDVRTNIWEINQAISKSSHAGDFWQKLSDSFPIGEMLSALLAFLLFAILVYSIVTTLNLSSRTITDFLPDKHSKLIRFVIMIVLIFIFIVLTNNLGSLLNQLRWGETSNGLVAFAEGNLMMALIDIILGSINIWLLKDFHEGK